MLNPLNLLSKIIKSSNQKEIERINKIVKKINDYENIVSNYTEGQFKERSNFFQNKLKSGIDKIEILPEAFALVREASKRVNNEKHFDVQLIGGIVLNECKIAEMKTGEGKTLTIVLAAYLNALDNNGVHIVTVNDYLAKRDSENMGKIYNYLGISCGYINSGQSDEERRKNYNCDITYATNSELGFDYLRDNMKYSTETMVQRGHNFAIVDEIDSCLIDEARTPLVISGQSEDKTSQYVAINKLIKKLNKNHFEIDEKDKNILLTDKGVDILENILGDAGILKNNNFYDPDNISLVHFVNQALRANHLFHSGKDYIVRDNQIIIIDEQTGRQLPGRRYGDGLHQSLEAKENLEVQAENQTLASITYQNYFKLYSKLCGCTGTALTESEEFYEIYNLPVISIPTNKKMIRDDINDKIFRTQEEKDKAIINKIQEINLIGQPILVFTSSINKSEHYSRLLNNVKINHTVLNAKNHEREADIIANAGKKFSIIITTSISGRGVDIKLGGKDNDQEKKNEIKSLGGLFVIGTERMESRRVDNQARGRAGRQGDEGVSNFYVSLDDDLMRIFGSDSLNNVLKKLGLKDGESIDHPWINKALERAQQKVEARNFDIRKTLLKFDNVLNDQRQVIFNQRNKIINSNKDEKYGEEFLAEILKHILKIKKNNISNPKYNDLSKELKKIFGKSFSDEEINKLQEFQDKDFTNFIKNKYHKKKQDRINILGVEQVIELEKRILLQIIDQNWKNHIQYLEQLRQVIGLRSYGNRDPLIEYKKEAFTLFENLLEKLKNDLILILINLTIVQDNNTDEQRNLNKKKVDPKFIGKKIGRNDQCFCGSKKKYKHCCGSI